MIDIGVHTIEMEGPDDLSGLEDLIAKNEIDPEEITAVLAKTEGNGCVNDFTRGFATQSFKLFLSQKLDCSLEEVSSKVAFVMSGGTEGVMSPHATIFTRRDTAAEKEKYGEKSLAVSVGFTRDFKPEEIGTLSMVKEVEKKVKELMEEARIESAADIHFVQIKCPLLASENIEAAKERGKSLVTDDTYKSMGYSRGASALGVGLALAEISEKEIDNDSILNNWDLYSEVASTSAGIELDNCEIILFGNSHYSKSEYRIGHDVMKDAIDIEAILRAIKNSGLEFNGLPDSAQIEKIVNVFSKAEADPSGRVRGRRNTMLTDSDINHTRHARAVVNAIVSSVIGDPMNYVSGGAEHQGPAGGGPVAAIVEK